MSVRSLTYQRSVFKRYHSDKHFSEFLPTRWRQKSIGIDMERNYVTDTLCISTITQQKSRTRTNRYFRDYDCLPPFSFRVRLAKSCGDFSKNLACKDIWPNCLSVCLMACISGRPNYTYMDDQCDKLASSSVG